MVEVLGSRNIFAQVRQHNDMGGELCGHSQRCKLCRSLSAVPWGYGEQSRIVQIAKQKTDYYDDLKKKKNFVKPDKKTISLCLLTVSTYS